ncbi:adenylate kinase 9 isoform X1 [Cyanistes caeruleus]|nr:adenylate kinase 9 isoform X1 [Cyanistes caeruleus]XP_023779693.1 adenylate kinase 9 isoform X1 [Cyanistes caeruleus]XP_023779695.1 adenylate kinase 9 isoform X1 [Cyanistes caeruleus]XP_023779696.1 adenylate kinase 9 isoform X1 [Cyanistes caeruleus]
MASQEENQAQPFADIFDEDEAERSFLLSKPTCLIVFGKPGSGKKTLARKLAQRLNCIFIEASEVIETNVQQGTVYGLKCQELLCQGQSIPENLVTEMILQKIESPEAAHFGYVLTGFPSLSEEYMTIPQQIKKIMNLKLKPDILINIKCPDYELCQRISGQRLNPNSGEIYQRSQWDPKLTDKHKKEKDQDEEEDEEEDEERDEEEGEETGEGPHKKLESFHQLVHRPEDFLENAEKRIGIYKDIMLRPLEELLSDQDCRYLIEVDGSQEPDDVFEIVAGRLQSMDIQNAAPIIRLQSDQEEETLEGKQKDELLRALSSYKLMAPRYRWRRSRWGQVCPVALKEGDIVMGNPEFAVSFLGKMYVLSSQEAFNKFIQNPRPYLLPPMPVSPCKVFVFGPPFSGRTTICNGIAHNYKGKVLDMDKLIQQYNESREKKLEELQKDAVEKAIAAVKNRLESGEQSEESGIPEITADHPEVQAMVEEAMESASVSDGPMSPQLYAEVLEGAIAELMKTNKDRFPGASERGGWVVDNYPLSADHWSALSEKGLLPDTVVCLKDTQKDGACILRRAYLASRNENNSKILERPTTDEALKKEEDDAREGMEETLPSEKDQSPSAAEEKGEKIMQPEFAEDDFPDAEEMETIKMKIDLFMNDWEKVESVIKKSSEIQVVVLEIAEQTPESLLNQTVLVMEKPFNYYGWELSDEDLEEEAQDLAAEGENEEEEGEEEEEEEEDEGEGEEEEEEEEDEETIKQKKRHMGDSKHFCPVSLKENFVLYPGLQEYAAKYKEKIYYFSTSEYRDKFLKNPEEYVAHNEPLQAPPLRVCLLGIHGAGKTTCARQIADKLGIFHIQFEEYLQELILPKTKRKVGPSFDEDHEDDNKIPEELEDFSQTMTKTEKEKSKQEVELTDEEKSIKANLMDNKELPPEVLDKIVPDWWKKEPFRSTGFILDGFPRTSDEARYLSEQGLCPDVAVYIQVEEGDILRRLLPPRLEKWKDRRRKKKEYKKKLKELKLKKKIAKRREELLAERQKKKQEALENKDNDEATEEEEDDEDIEAILAKEFLEEEEEEEPEEEEENEEDAVERMQNEIVEKFESEIEILQSVKEELEKLLIPPVEINGGRLPRVVCYQIYSKLNSLVENRKSIFEKCYPISLSLAEKMLVFSYKLLSSFGQWDPIKLSQGDVIKPQERQGSTVFPVIHRQYIYFFSSKENKEIFMTNPIKYICQPKPKLSVPVKIAIVGLPKSGKTTVAQRLASAYGFLRLSLGDAIRFVINNQPESELALKVQSHLLQGLTVPDELAIQALDVTLLNHVDNATGVVIDGYPLTRNHVNLLESTKIIPVKIFELDMDTKEVFRRALLDKETKSRLPYPEHDSPQILAIKNSCYKQHIDDIRTYYMKEHQNWCVIDANHSKWKVWNTIEQEVQVVVKQIQIYLERRKEGKAASIADLCITPKELQDQLGECGQYSPVSLAEKGELIDCSVTPSLEFTAEFQGRYYKMASQEELEKFLSRPDVYVSSLASHPLPPPYMLPKKLTAAEVKALFPLRAEMRGYCPVTYLDGKQRYEALVPGNIEYAAKYQDKVYIFESEEKLQKFMRLPEKYWNLKLPHKLPPKKEPMLLTMLPLAGYLEQGVATSLIKALHEVGSLKPKYPFLSVKETALLFVSFHLKAHNPRSSEPVRQMYRKKLLQFVEHCQLIPYLGTAMAGLYKEPRDRPPGFDDRLQTFLSLKGTRPTFV